MCQSNFDHTEPPRPLKNGARFRMQDRYGFMTSFCSACGTYHLMKL
jgi:hypothetical protein